VHVRPIGGKWKIYHTETTKGGGLQAEPESACSTGECDGGMRLVTVLFKDKRGKQRGNYKIPDIEDARGRRNDLGLCGKMRVIPTAQGVCEEEERRYRVWLTAGTSGRV